MLELAGDDPSLRLPLSPAPTVETGVIGAEILYAFRREMAQTLADVLLRRTMVGLGPRVGLDVDEAAAEVAAKHLGWSEEQAERRGRRLPQVRRALQAEGLPREGARRGLTRKRPAVPQFTFSRGVQR